MRLAIDEGLTEKPKNLDVFLIKMKSKGFEIKTGKYLAFRGSGQKKFTRLRSLGESYQEENLREVIEGKKQHKPQKKIRQYNDKKVNLIIDLQSKLSQKKGAGYERWAKTFNIKQLAKTMNYLTENNLLNYEDLRAKAEGITDEFSLISDSIKSAEKQMAGIALLQTSMTQFAKTKGVYEDYKKSGYSSQFKEENITDILIHQAD